jgi:hypothetical protein
MGCIRRVDIEVYDEHGAGHWPQARYLVHGHDDVLWTNDPDSALAFLREGLTEGVPHPPPRNERIVAEGQRAVVLALRRVLTDIERGADNLGDAKGIVRYFLGLYEKGARTVDDEIESVVNDARKDAFKDAIASIEGRMRLDPGGDR